MCRLLKKVILMIYFGNGLGNIKKNISGNFEIFTKLNQIVYFKKIKNVQYEK